MIDIGDGRMSRRLMFGRCPRCDIALPSMLSGRVSCTGCDLSISVEPCTYTDSLGKCRDGMIREPDGMGCVQWTTCIACQGRGWV